MRLYSIEAAQFGRGDRGQHLPLHTAERGFVHHDRAIELHAGTHRRWVDAHDVHDMPYPPGTFDSRLKLPFEHAGRIRNGNLFDPGHGGMITHGPALSHLSGSTTLEAGAKRSDEMEITPTNQLLDFSGKVVLVTGGGSGIGAGIAQRFAEAGADVAVSFFSSEAGANEVVGAIHALGRKAIAIQADVRSRELVERLVQETVGELGHLDVLINNAGIDPLAPLMDMTDEQWDEVVNTNLRGVFLCTQVGASQMIQQGSEGAIVNIASIEAQNPAALHSHYNASKAGIVMHTRASARELGEHGIRVNVVSPGLIWEEDLDQAWPDGVSRYLYAAPLKRIGQPDDVADACLFFASPAARWITGANLVVDGGVLTSTVY